MAGVFVASLVSAGSSLLVAVGLWAFLPRGVVLTKSGPIGDDTWRLRNDSSLDICVISARATNVFDWDEGAGRPREFAVGTDGGYAAMAFDDHHLYTGHTDRQKVTWRGVTIPAGETLTVRVGVNATLVIRYRRSGWSGVLERRTLVLHGYS